MFPEEPVVGQIEYPEADDNIQQDENLEEGEILEPHNTPPRDLELKLMLSQIVPEVVKELENTLRTICVPERVLLAEKSAQDWQRMAEMAIRKPEIFKHSVLNRSESHPVFLPLKEFLNHPMSGPIWRLQTRLNLSDEDINFGKWWKRIHSDSKINPIQKLAKYLEMINLFLATGDNFWPVMATNPTYFSVQRVASELAAMAGWLKASALELHQLVEAYVAASNDVAQCTQKVSEVYFAIRFLWPAGYKPDELHFEGDPYVQASLYAREDDTQCLVTPQYKVFAFDAQEKWQNEQPFKRHKLTNPSQFAKRKLEHNTTHASRPMPFSMIGRT